MARTKKPDSKSTVEGKTSAKKTTTSVSSKKVKKEESVLDQTQHAGDIRASNDPRNK